MPTKKVGENNMANREIPIQFAFEQILGQSHVFGEPTKETKHPFLLLSQSKLEQLAYYQDHPQFNPDQITSEQLNHFTAGIIFHKIAQVTSTWLAILPHDIHDLTENYQKNLHRFVGNTNPTSQSHEITSLYHLLNDDRFIIPGRKGKDLYPVKQTIYHLIADQIIRQEINKPPFIDTPVIDPNQFSQFFDNQANPSKIRQIWDEQQYSELIHQRVDNLFNYHQSRIYNPSKIARQSPGDYGQEVRANLIMPHLGIIWSTRFDEIYFTKSYDDQRHIHILDYKLGHAKFEPRESQARDTQRLSLYMTALVAQHLPEKLPITGKAIQLKYHYPVSHDTVNITYLGFKDSPNQIDFTNYYGHDWTYEGSARTQLNKLADTIAYIQANRQSLTSIFPLK